MTAKVRGAAVAAGAISGLLFGFDTAVIGGINADLREVFQLSAYGMGAAISAALWGTLVGALGAGSPGDRFGSRAVLLWVAILYVVSAIGSAVAWNLESFFFFRFVGGLAIGGSSVLAPVYLSEISPTQRRGFIVGLFQLNIVLGILVAFLSNYIIGQLGFGDIDWRVKLGVAAIPALILLGAMLTIPASPRWLLSKGRREEALDAIRNLRMGDPETVAADIQPEQSDTDRLSWTKHRRPILLALAIATFNQLSGINAILYYIGDIFASAGYDAVSSDLQSVAVGAANFIATMIGLTLIDRLGRRPLLMIGAAGTFLALVGVALIYSTGSNKALLLPMLIMFIGFFAISQGAVIWVYLSEIFPTEVRSRGQALGSATHWILNAIISFAFPVVAAKTLAAPFWVFAGAVAVQLFVVWRFFPETKGVKLDQMDARTH
jgi:sugar porter (SP) family MFS transporter